MEFNIKKFKSNIMFFIVCAALVVCLSLLSLLIDKSARYYDEEDLNDKEVNIKKLVINEIMTSNKGTITDGNGKLYDYIEIYNGNNHDINLKNYGLSDENEKVKWVFGNVTIEAKSYLVVFMSGKSGELSTDFKLKSAGGEVVALIKPNGKAVDAIETVALDSNTVMARDGDGKWVIQDKPTPGFANNIQGHEEFMKSLESKDEKSIIVNEVLAENKGNFKNANGDYSGYVELKNVSGKTINLEGYSLSNSEDVNFKWQLPKVSLSNNEVLVVYTSGVSSIEGTLSTGFKLKNKNGVVVVGNPKGEVIDKLKYENLGNGVALIRQGNKYLESNAISPGYENTVDGIKSFQKKYLDVPKSLIINEAMNSNYSYIPQNGGNYYDWIELYNNSGSTVNLSDYCLTTNINTSCMYNLPKVELKKGEYYIVMASGNENLSNNKYKHAPFKLGDNEAIYLTKSSTIVDSMYMANVPKGYSMGKGSSYGVYYFSKPTPAAKNGNGTEAVSYVPKASVESGIFNKSSGFQVTLNGNGNIYYTLDGSKPTTSSKVYSGPLTVKKTTVLRIMSKESGKLSSPVISYSYIVNENHSLPVMSLVMNQSDFKYVNSHTALNSPVIKPVSVELLETDGTGFKIDAGLKLFGGSTRYYRKKSYEIKFKKQFGDGKLKYKVFDTVDSSVFDSLVLRSGSQDEFAYSKRVLIRDIVATSLMHDYTKVDVQAYKPCVVYVNGKYWGLYFIREKVDETFVANHYNVKTTKTDTDILRIDGEVKTGSSKKYKSMMSFINNNSMANNSNYNKIKEQIDIENFCDFWVAEIWSNNYDIVNQRYFSNAKIDNGKWKWIFYDLDSGFYNYKAGQYGFKYYTRTQGVGYGNFSTALLRNLMKNAEFRKTFLERLSYNLKNTWSSANFSKKVDDVIKEIGTDEIKRNNSRWNVCSYSAWQDHVKDLKAFAQRRNKSIVTEAKSYFHLSNAEVKKYFGDVK